MLYSFDVEGFIKDLKNYDPSSAVEYTKLAPLMYMLMDEGKTSQDIDYNSFTVADIERLTEDILAIDPEEPAHNDEENILWQIEMVDDLITFLMMKEPEKGGNPDDIFL